MLKTIAALLLLLTALACPVRAADETPVNPLGAPAAAPAAATPAGVAAAKPDAPEAEHGLMDFDLTSAIWTLIIFLVLLAVLYKGAWKNVLAGLKAREDRIRGDIAQAEAARLKAESTLRDYNAQLAKGEARAQEILAKATADAQALAERIKAEADKAAQDRVARATREIEEARVQAVRAVYDQAAELSTQIAEKILRRNLNAADQRDLVAQSLDQAQAINRG